jgi:hypothetical protein
MRKRDYILIPPLAVLYIVAVIIYTVSASIYWLWTRKVLQVL